VAGAADAVAATVAEETRGVGGGRRAHPSRVSDHGVEPLYVVPSDPRWPRLFEAERERVEAVLGTWAVAVEHVGSTSVRGLDAKPVVDLLVGLGSMGDAGRCVWPLEGLGYEHRGEAGIPGRLFFRKFRAGRRAYHLHLTALGGEFWNEHLLFRDHLRACPETAARYARLKHELAARAGDDRAAYTAAKGRFARDVLERAGGLGHGTGPV
jgi:GrpB-like predicted nucleotidyltransferase (UPF0157 family)